MRRKMGATHFVRVQTEGSAGKNYKIEAPFEMDLKRRVRAGYTMWLWW